ncbi:MAG: hypothetical protein HND48_21550 [Chloroflexi bacterium]|nr:hypothetical protein [Chloroflexota bacterium]
MPVGEWLDGFAREPSLRTFFLDLVGPLSFEADPEALSAAHFVLAVRPLLMPKGPIALYPAGGWIPHVRGVQGAHRGTRRQRADESRRRTS